MATCKLRYKMNPDKQSYTVVGIQGARKPCVHIPKMYRGLPVTAIGKKAFDEDILHADFLAKQAKREHADMEKIKKMSAARQKKIAKGQSYMREILYTGIRSVRIPSSVTEIGEYAFYSCGALSCVTVEDSLQCPHQLRTIKDHAFAYCEALDVLALPATVTEIGADTFLKVPLGSVTIDEANPRYAMRDEENGARSIVEKETGTVLISSSQQISRMAFERRFQPKAVDPRQPAVGDLFGGLRYKKTADGESYVVLGLSAWPPKRVRVPKTYRSLPVIAIGWKAFENSKIEEITLPNSLERIEAVAFDGCRELKTVTIEQSNVTENRLKQLGISVFQGCSRLTAFSFPDSITKIESNMFGNGVVLRSLTVMEGNPVYHSEENCVIETATGTLVMCASGAVPPQNGTVKRIGAYSFGVCSEFPEELMIPDSVEEIEKYAFFRARGLKKIRIPDGVRVIGDAAFYMTGIETISLPEGVKNLSASVFDSCMVLQSISLPGSLLKIEKRALAECLKLTDIRYAGTVSDFQKIKCGEGWKTESPFSVVHCTDGDVTV